MKKTFIFILSTFILCSQIFAEPLKVIMLRDNGPLRVEEGNSGVKWAQTISAGTELELVSEKTVTKNLITTDKTYPDVDFYIVKYKDNKYYVQVSEVGLAPNAAVMCQESVLFTKPSLAYFRNAILEPGTIVAVGKRVKVDDLNFAEVSFFDTNDGIKRTRYVMANAVSENEKDVKAILMVQAALAIKDETLRNETLNNAQRIKTTDYVTEYIESLIDEKLGLTSYSEDDIIEVNEYTAKVTTKDGAKVNVRSTPGTKGNIVGKLDSTGKTKVIVTLKTTTTEKIEGITDSWYYVTEIDSDGFEKDTKGWVFGGYLKK